MASPFIVKASGNQERFSQKKLILSLQRSGASHSVAKRIAQHAASLIRSGTTTKELFDIAHQELREIDRPKAFRYSLKRGIFELGPSGFPFEQIIGRLFLKLGFQVQTNLMISGKCVDHEVDVIAKRLNETNWVECKFHNQQGMFCDLKTALYIFARFIDLNEGQGDSRKKVMWLISNTRLSDEALRFSECRGVKLLAWDYPRQGGLNVLLERYHLYPITIVSTLSRKQKLDLIKEGLLTCDDFLQNKERVLKLGVSERKWNELSTDLENLVRSLKN